jgi:hypothetical protein
LVLALGVLFGATGARADVIAFDGISVAQLAHALEHQPVQQRGSANPALSSSDIDVLRTLIHRTDPGRIWIAVVTPISEHDVGLVANSLANLINKDGIVLVVGGYNFYVSTTWGNSASSLLSSALGNGTAPFPDQLQAAVLAFAKADSKAHHPRPLAASLAPPAQPKPHKHKASPGTNAAAISPSSSGTRTSSTGTSASATTGSTTGAAAGQTSTSTAGTSPASTSGPKHKSGSSSTALIIVGAAVGVLLLIGLATFLRQAREGASVRKHERDEVHDKANADLTKLGEKISDLDIDQQMPNADPGGKAEYVKALDCYQGGERRLKDENDPREFDKAIEVIAAGLKHIDAAEQLFDHHGRARDLLPAEVVTRLTKLAALHKSGALTDAEFTAEKQKLLS